MIKIMSKRLLPLLLAVLMCVSALPLHVFADAIATANVEQEKENQQAEEIVTTPSEMATDMVKRINKILETYGVTSDMTDDEIRAAINAQPWSVNKPNISEISQIEYANHKR